jgi:electron-transferring-flavoprotein dehydrogenase
MTHRDTLTYDVLIIGAGPAGLAAAIRLKQQRPGTHVGVIEKAASLGGHSLAGAVLEPRALDELLPAWRTDNGFTAQPVTSDGFLFLASARRIALPCPPQMHNTGNVIVSIAELVRYLGKKAEELGVEILPGFAAHEALAEDGRVVGVRTGDFGVDKDGTPGSGYAPGPDLKAKVTLLAEGCRGHLTKSLVERFQLAGTSPQSYGVGHKEIWRIKPDRHRLGRVEHTLGFPLDSRTYGGGWIYHLPDNKVSIGFVVGLDYADPSLMPHELMQRYKTHPHLAHLLEGGELLFAGARALYEGGEQGQYKLAIPGALLVGDTAGFLNVPKIKGIHTAMKSGMLAAEAVADHLENGAALESYPTRVKNSWLGAELHRVRNIRPGFQWGLWLGLANAGFETLTAGRAPWTLLFRHADHEALEKRLGRTPTLPAAKTTIDRLTSVSLTFTRHNEHQPSHLKIADPDVCTTRCTEEYGNPCTRFCPAGVYEMIRLDEKVKLQVNAANCIHCKTCDIKDPYQIITWVTPEGGSGPNYSEM